jgi:FkbM family methyltransferase
MKYYSQFEQDKVVYESYFQDKTNGYFVDIGAHDGVTFSNSKFFEELGWTGVCAEPNPIVFEQLQSVRKCKCVKKAIADKIGHAQFFQIVEGADMLSGLVDEFSQKGIKNIYSNLESEDGGFDYIDVELDLFDNIVDQTEIDFLSIDTEGNELKILQTIDFSKYNIKVITLENNEYDSRFVNFLSSKDFTFVKRLGCDELYINNKFI